ncbi:DUF305 domain-containing protein [Umezawaea beigongshangensis]|uniref:DUF305 domain-containing protein n=1 Tax=Umezawaea beigongshangensis TaxID=2780383 RepID=UPI0018F15000|nr:DUF305 domain-containing protein [Umezawaea beigongshangensis]
MKRYPLAALVTGAALLLAGCGGTVDAGSPAPAPAGATSAAAQSAGEFNDADVAFLQMMIPHHEQGIEMAKLAKEKATRAEVKELAGAIEATQAAEVQSMRSWLEQWKQPLTAAPGTDPHAGHGGDGGDHSTDPSFITDLATRSGPEFETQFLSLLTGHQHNAVDMAKTETEQGSDDATKDLAARVVQSRQEQIKQMLTLVGG